MYGGTLASAALVGRTQADTGSSKRAKIKIGQVGVGHSHASGKMGAYRRSPDYEVVGLVEPDEALHETARQGVYEGVPLMSLEQLLNVPGLQAVAVETRVRDLLDVAETCVNNGLHIHLDKPPGDSLARFGRILDLAARKKLLVQMGYMYRYNPGVVLLRDFLTRGYLGEPFEIHAVMSKVVSPTSRRRMAEFAGGVMFELGCHLIDLVVAIMGRPQEVTSYRQHTSERDDELCDNMLAVFTYPRALASVKSSGNEVEGFARRHFVLCGSEGTCHIQPLDRPSVRVAFSRPRGDYKEGYQDVSVGGYERYVADAADMAEIIRGEHESRYSYEHDRAVQETVLKACGLAT
jgi:predicted dehydrogenase